MTTHPIEPGQILKARAAEESARRARWIRPTPAGKRLPASPAGWDAEAFAALFLDETRRRVLGLAALERELEEKIAGRWEEAEAEARRRLERAEEEASASRKRAESESRERSLRLEKEGRAAGFHEGFARGREEGYRLGLEEGRRDGEREGREQASRRLDEELSGASRALATAAIDLRKEREKLLRAAKNDLLQLAVEIARRLVKREIRETSDVTQRNVEKAIELIFRGGAVVIQVHPDDAPQVQKAIAEEPRWAEGFDSVQVRAAPDVGRGGCRLISGAGTVDMTIATQLELLQSALEGALDAPWLEERLEESGGAAPPAQGSPAAPAARGESP